MEGSAVTLHQSILTNPQTELFSHPSFFFIKSKHAFPNYRNHSYFQALDSKCSFLKKDAISDSAIQNTFSFQNQKNNHKLKIRTEQNKAPLRDSKIQMKQRSKKKIIKERLLSLPSLKEQRKLLANEKSQQLINKKSPIVLSVSFYYVSKCKSIDSLQKSRRIQINILPFFTSSFKRIRQQQTYKWITFQEVQFLKRAISKAISVQKQPYEYKDIVSLSSLQSILAYLKNYEEDSVEWIEIIRYFFVASREVCEYQIERLKQQLRAISQLKYDVEFGKDIWLFDRSNAAPIRDLYALVHCTGNVLYGENAEATAIYDQLVKDKQASVSLIHRLRKWRSKTFQFGNKHNQEGKNAENQEKSRRNCVCQNKTNTPMAVQVYHQLFNKFQNKRIKITRRRLLMKKSQFISRQKLIPKTNIFQ